MDTFVSVERVLNLHAVALGLPSLGAEESMTTYVERVAALGVTAAKRTELARCLTEAVNAASVAAHDDVHNWLAQARNHVPA